MDMELVALGMSLLVNVGMFAYVLYKGSNVNTVEALAEFKKAVVKMKTIRDKAGVDAATITAGIPSILELLSPAKA